MKSALLFFCGTILLANVVLADGAYQRTRDQKTFVWNPDVRADEAATWSGARDKESFATGEGTVTWYRIKRSRALGARIPEQYMPVVRYSGRMVRGKLDGPITAVDDKGQTFHASFAEGVRRGDWAAGSASQTSSLPAQPAPREATPTSNDAVAADQQPVRPAEGESVAGKQTGAESVTPNAAAAPARSPAADIAAEAPATAQQDRTAASVAEREPAERPAVDRTTTTVAEGGADTRMASPPPVALGDRRDYPRRATGRRPADPADALRSLTIPAMSLRQAGLPRGLTVVPPAAGSPSPSPRPGQSSNAAEAAAAEPSATEPSLTITP